jgi:hypothetical protein
MNHLRQTILLHEALKERGLNYKKYRIEINHDLGYSKINEIRLPIIYPDSFWIEAKKFHNNKKIISFYFNGHPGNNNSRKQIIENFIGKQNSVIKFNQEGRIVENKNKMNYEYFLDMSRSKYTLCPHQLNWPGDKNALWTYRFIESMMVKSVPIIFRKTPLCEDFIEEFFYQWDDDQLPKKIDHTTLEENFIKARNKFSLPENLKDIL